MLFFPLLVKIQISVRISYKTHVLELALMSLMCPSHVRLTCFFFPMWIEQIPQVLFVAKAVGSVAFVSVSFSPVLVSIVF